MTAVIYARYSSDSQREASIEGQLRDCKDYAERNGITIVGTYIDRAYSAKTDDRPEFQRMVQDSARKIFDAVLVWKLDRFARNRSGSWTALPATATMQFTTNASLKGTASISSQSWSQFRTALRAS